MTHTKVGIMYSIALLLLILPYCLCSGEGNIHLMEEDIAAALKSCRETVRKTRHTNRYSDSSPRIDGGAERNQYNHERRNNTFSDKINILNGSYPEDGRAYDDNFINHIPRPVHGHSYNASNYRAKRSESLFSKETDQCLSQCVFANLQVVDMHGIPREAQLWNKVETAVTSQQSRAILRDQIRACFQEMQTESEDNGCSYSNKLERCLMLRFSDRKINANNTIITV
ncbi:uncharacterized protein LOC121737173 [Aricia agestis]|uniref:uncharacterized protein LOC121737173 n=1 Tax=Aricia agestis TaxID=91739 RepID=UPI001C20B560|nr:uncharacterized protein LOC121737173 [Aricia agestis]